MSPLNRSLTKDRFICVDPRTKLIVFFLAGFMGILGVSQSVVLMFYLIIALLLINGRESYFALKSLLLYGICIGARYLFLSLDTEGVLGSVLILFTAIIIQFLPVFMAFMMLFKTTTVSQFIAAFQKMHVPLGFVIAFSVMIRFIPTVKEEWESIKKAMKFRGITVSVGGVLFRPGQTCEYILLPLFNSIITIIDELSAASLSRGLDCESQRTCITQVKMRLIDVIICILCITGLVLGGNL